MSIAEIKWPSHKASLTLTHNDHLSYYHTVQQAIDDNEFGMDSWVSEEQKQKAIETNDCWTLQWYPDTPIGFGFCILAAADLDVLLAKATEP